MGTSNMFLLLITFVFYAAPISCDASISGGLRLELTRIDSMHNFSKLELLQRAATRSNHRMSRLIGMQAVGSESKAATQSLVHPGNGEFLMDLSIGTPPVPYSAILDTGSDLIWTQCKPCIECFDQPTPIFDPSTSSTFSSLPCSGELCGALPTSACDTNATCEYLYTYGDSSSTQGILGTETFTFGPNIGFGCGDTNRGGGFSQGGGLVGLGRGPLSLVSQLSVGKFSYCLTPLDAPSKKSPLLFGSVAEFSGAGRVLSTPLIKNSLQPSFYYLSLKGISVGGRKLKIPSTAFALQDDGSGGLIIDSGTSITYLETDGYEALKKAFLSRVRLPVADGSDVGLDLCFSVPASSSSSTTSVDVPKLVFHFDGADLELPAENYMVLARSDLLCLTVMGSTGMSIFGNFQQQNMQILYDLEKNMLSLVSAQCDQL